MLYPKISIVTPSYNQGCYIEQTITSVLDQQYPNLEYIIIDGGSTDNTVDIIRKYEKHLAYWVSQPDKGQTDGINKGFKKCTGEIFNWLNSDDYYAPNALKVVGEAFSSDQSTQVVCGKEYGFYDDQPQRKVLHKGSIIHPTVEETIFTGIIDQPCTFFNRKAIESFFPLNVSLKYVMDRQLWWSFLAENGTKDISRLDNVLTYFRLHSSSKSVLEGDKFEDEFLLLKLALLKQIDAPQWMIEHYYKQAELISDDAFNLGLLQFKAVNKKKLLGVFAYNCALRSYVRDDLTSTHVALKVVKNSGFFKKEYIPLFIKAGILPPAILKRAKRLKKALHWKN